jgi:hypothetical protein
MVARRAGHAGPDGGSAGIPPGQTGLHDEIKDFKPEFLRQPGVTRAESR